MSDLDGSNEGTPTRWSVSRVIAAVFVLVVILAGVGYGIYSLTRPTKASPAVSSHLVAPKTTTNKPTTSPTTKPTTTQVKPAVTPPPATTKQLTNTGPGNIAIIGFLAAFLVGAAFHYGWRNKHHSN